MLDVLYIRISLPDSNTHPSHFSPQFSLIFPTQRTINHIQACSRLIYFGGLPTHLTQDKERKHPILEQPRVQLCDADALRKAVDVTL